MTDEKATLQRYLQTGRDALLWKLEDVEEYDKRRPLVPSGTNLLGLVKHVAGVEAGYFGVVFGRPFPEPMPWIDSGEVNADMWATASETSEAIIELYRRASRHADATIDALPLDTAGEVPWWPPERRSVTLHQVLVHMVAETHRHAGHADIVRELIDGAVGMRPQVSNVPDGDRSWWASYFEQVEAAARAASATTT